MDSLGGYLLLKRIGYGGMAEVFLASPRDELDGEMVVVKRILPKLQDNAEIREMFRDELRISSLLHHRNIVRVEDFGEDDGVPYIVLEYVDGLPLGRLCRITEAAEPPIPLACWIVAEACAGLAYAHTRKLTYSRQPLGIVHRDISPDNVLLSRRGEVKLTDFGVAKTAVRLAQDSPEEVKGKYGYMAPEQVRGDPVDHRADIFAAGATLYEITTGSPLFGSYSPVVVLNGIMQGHVVPPEERVPDYPAALAAIVATAIAWDPAQRYQDAGQMRRDLLAWLREDLDPSEQLAALITDLTEAGANRAPPGGGAPDDAVLDTVVELEPRGASAGRGLAEAPRRSSEETSPELPSAVARRPPASDPDE